MSVAPSISLAAPNAFHSERDLARGYSVRYGRLALAYAIEIVVVAASLVGAWLFAQQYGAGSTEVAMMMLAPVGYAAIEFCRVPLAFSARTQTSWVIRILAVIAVVCAAGVTVKSMSQLGEVMFRPRLQEVKRATSELDTARAQQQAMRDSIAAADQAVALHKSNVDREGERARAVGVGLAALPRPQCWTVTRRLADGRTTRSQQCRDDSRTAPMRAELERANIALAAAQQGFDGAVARRRTLDPTPADNRAAQAAATHDEAVYRSQLHSFTAMAFGKDPKHVTDGQIAEFLRVFVFLPAIFVSFAATMLAVTSVDRIRRRPEDDAVAMAEEAGHYILGPYSQTIIDAAAQRVLDEQRATVAAATRRGRPPPSAEPAADAVVAPPPAANATPAADTPASPPSEAREEQARDAPTPGVVTPLRRV